tara:strand:+ start:1129 stop:1971 length:843 start_codon:yes stop_codon:yes gene_type:complete
MEIFLNGEFIPEEKAYISPFDRGFMYGDGAFETLRVYNAKAFLLERHLGRLTHTLDGLSITDPYSFEDWFKYCNQLVQRNGLNDCIMRIQVSRGVGRRGYGNLDTNTHTSLISIHEAPPISGIKTNLNLITASNILNDHNPLSTMKTANKLVNIIAMREAEMAGADDALLLNREGNIAETTSGNIFAFMKGDIHTPPISSGCLSGITRGLILDLAKDLGISCLQNNITQEQLSNSDGAFLTNSVRQIQPIGSLDEKVIPENELTYKFANAYIEQIAKTTS